MTITKEYNSTFKNEWDNFIDSARNSHFMFKRDYIDYHAERFRDSSLMFYQKNELLAVIPANKENSKFYTHQGLTFGGIISGTNFTSLDAEEVINEWIRWCKTNDITEIIYKKVPYIYSKYPCDEDLYFMHLKGAQLMSRSISSVLVPSSSIEPGGQKKRYLKKATKLGVKVEQSADIESYWRILETVLKERHNTLPVHSLNEIKRLYSSFPENIKLFSAVLKDKIIAGVLVYETGTTAHCQYIAGSDEGREIGALDLIFHYLINKIYIEKPFFDFGISTEDGGKFLNKGLIRQKEGMGGRAVNYDTYVLNIC